MRRWRRRLPQQWRMLLGVSLSPVFVQWGWNVAERSAAWLVVVRNDTQMS